MKLPKVYEASQYESDIYALWEQSRAFVADPKSGKEHFSIAMPPPNETGTLHIGHALFLTLQDIIARHERQKGKDVLWLPGTDHAALATNALIEKEYAEQGKSKHEVGREDGSARRTGDRDAAVLERLAQHLERASIELRHFVEEEHAVVRE